MKLLFYSSNQGSWNLDLLVQINQTAGACDREQPSEHMCEAPQYIMQNLDTPHLPTSNNCPMRHRFVTHRGAQGLVSIDDSIDAGFVMLVVGDYLARL